MKYGMSIILSMIAVTLGFGDEPQAATRKVLLIGIDGLRSDAIPAATVAHNLHALIKAGCYSDRCDVVGERAKGVFTATGPGWSSVLTGVWADKHGVKDNSFRGETIKDYPTVFRRLRESKPNSRMAALITWQQFDDYLFTKADGGRYLVDGDKKGYEEADRVVAAEAVKILANDDIDLLFAYFGQVDGVGHGYGFHPKSPKYTKGIEFVDEHIGKIHDAIRKRPNFKTEDWLIIVCTDHGGLGKGHTMIKNEPEIRYGPLLLHGPSVTAGKLTDVRNIDIAPTILTHLGVKLQDAWKLDGQSVGLKPRKEK